MRISCVNQVSYPKNFFNKSFFDVRKNIFQPKNTLSFLGYPVYIVDGGAHADNMEHFANAISKDMETQIRPVETLVEHDTIKNLKSLEKRLQELNEENNLKNAFIIKQNSVKLNRILTLRLFYTPSIFPPWCYR